MARRPMKYRKKRKSRRKRPYRRRKSYIPRVPAGMAKQTVAKIRYSEKTQITSSTGILQTYVYRANSVYDPNLTGIGHTPRAFTQWTNMFNHYTVLGAKISVVWTNSNDATGAIAPTYVGVILDDNGTIPSDYDTIREAKMGSSTIVGTGSANSYVKSYTGGKYSAKRFHNVTDVKDNSALRSLVNTNPTEQALFVLWVQGAGSSSVTLAAHITIDYIVSFSEPKLLD